MENEIAIRLKSFGYTVTDGDKPLITYITAKIEQDIKNATNLNTVPEGLKYEWIDAVCSEFLSSKLATGGLENVSQIAKSIQEGDTNITFDNSVSPEAQLLTCLEALKLNVGSLVKYRVMVW